MQIFRRPGGSGSLRYFFFFSEKKGTCDGGLQTAEVWTMERKCLTLTLLCLALSGVGAVQVDIPESTYEKARGDNITLPCIFKPRGTPTAVIISWSAEGLKPNDEQVLILTYYSFTEGTDVTPPYEGRASLDVNIKEGKADLKLFSISLADNKKFQCRVQIPNDDEGQRADTATLVVLVAPSVPICKIQGKAEYGQNINLTCVSEEGSPPPTYSWQSRDVRNIPRSPAPRTTDKGGILSLYNISKDTSGFYTCTSRNKIRSATCNITLSVMPPSMNIGSTAGIIGGVVAGLVILIIVIYCCCCRKKKQQEEDYALGVREGEYSDKEPVKNGEGRKPDGQEDTRGYDDSSVRGPVERRDRYEERSERDYDRDYDDRRSDYSNLKRDYDDRRSDYDDRRRVDYDDRRSDYDDRRSDYNDRDRYSDRDERRYDDRRDRRYDDDRYDDSYDDRDKPRVPANKPARMDYDD